LDAALSRADLFASARHLFAYRVPDIRNQLETDDHEDSNDCSRERAVRREPAAADADRRERLQPSRSAEHHALAAVDSTDFYMFNSYERIAATTSR
jgi:hypothetical protein